MIKLFEQFNNEQKIIDICELYNIKNYTINPDESIDVDGGVDLSDMKFTKIPIKFNKVSGNFYCQNNYLSTLISSPKYVGGDFYCSENDLTSLEGSPNYVGGYFSCSFNHITSLVGCPNEVGGGFYCSNNQLTNLKGSPNYIGGNFNCSNNKLITLVGSPIIIDKSLEIEDNPISIIDSSIEVKGVITLMGTNFDYKIKSLSQEKLRILFEHGVDYDIIHKDGTINDKRLERLFRDFEI